MSGPASPRDPGDRHVVEQIKLSLAESEARLELVLEAAGLGTFSVDLVERTAYYSPELAVMLGFPDARAVPVDEAFRRVHHDDVDYVKSRFEAALDPARDGRLRMELRYVRPGGEVRWMMWNGRIEFGEGPEGRRPVRVLGACADVTERKEAEERLRQSEARFRSLVELSSDWYWEQDENFHFTAFSTSVERMTGADIPNLVGKARWELPTAGMSEEAWAEHRALLERHEPFRNFEFQRVTPQGERIWVSVNGDPLFDAMGRFRGYRGTGQNITARKLADARLKESEARFRLLADSAPVLIWVTGEAGGEFFNRPYLKFVGARSEDELTGIGWAEFLHPEDRGGYVREFAESEARLGQFEAQVRFRRADGAYRWMKSIGQPRFSADGRCLGYVGSALDITDVKNNEERIAHLARELDHRVKNILNRFAVVIDRTGDAPLGKEEFVAALKQRIESMARTHSLLSRTNWSGAPLDALILDQLEAYATAKNLDISGEPVVVTPDAAQSLSMVFNELATNAAKYGALSVPSGQVRVRWHRERRADGEALVIAWQEQEGPTVAPPATEGYGTSVIRGLLAHEFAAAVNLAMLAAGVHCVITLPVVGVVTDS